MKTKSLCELSDLPEIHPELLVARSWQSPIAKVKVICAWCRHEGNPGYLGEREPFDNRRGRDAHAGREARGDDSGGR